MACCELRPDSYALTGWNESSDSIAYGNVPDGQKQC